MNKLLLLSSFTVIAANAQLFSVGLLGGAPFNDVAKNSVVSGVQSIPKSSNFTIGPAFQVNLPAGVRVEVDALYRPYEFVLITSNRSTSVQANISAQQWRFPVLLQYRFGTPIVKPFLEVGVSFDHLAGLSSAAKSITSGPGQLLHQSDASAVLGGGVDVKIPFFRVSGELRYTRQSVSYFNNFSNLDQAEILLGIHF
jgi:hypothetical protein